VKEIPLTQGFVALVDDEDYARLAAFKWHAARCRDGRVYAGRWNPDLGRNTRMHREISGWDLTDHADGDGLNNQRSNLRRCSASDNMRNRKVARTARSQYKGLSPGRGARWRAFIRAGGKQRCLGTFATQEDAARAYDAAARAAFGEYAALNFPEPNEQSARRLILNGAPK